MNQLYKPIGKYKSLNILSVTNILDRKGLYAWIAIKIFRSKFIYIAYLDNGLRLPFSELEKAAYDREIKKHQNVMGLYRGMQATMNQYKTGGQNQ